MRPGQQNKRMRGRGGNRRGPNPLSRSYESNGPDVKVRGTPAHIAEKYMQLARDANASGDPVAAESYLQHAEHYFRIIAAAQAQAQQNNPQEAQQQPRSRYNGVDGRYESDNDDSDDTFDDAGDGSDNRQQQPQPAAEAREGGDGGRAGQAAQPQPQQGEAAPRRRRRRGGGADQPQQSADQPQPADQPQQTAEAGKPANGHGGESGGEQPPVASEEAPQRSADDERREDLNA